MNDLFWIDVVSRIIHVATAISLIGGSVFITFVLHPVVSKLAEDQRQVMQDQLIGRWKWFVHLGILLFLVSGFYNFFRAIPIHRGDGFYHGLIGIKILLALWVMFLASALVGRSARFAGMRNNRGLWGKVLIISALVIVCISGFAKVRDVPSEITESGDQPAVESVEAASN